MWYDNIQNHIQFADTYPDLVDSDEYFEVRLKALIDELNDITAIEMKNHSMSATFSQTFNNLTGFGHSHTHNDITHGGASSSAPPDSSHEGSSVGGGQHRRPPAKRGSISSALHSITNTFSRAHSSSVDSTTNRISDILEEEPLEPDELTEHGEGAVNTWLDQASPTHDKKNLSKVTNDISNTDPSPSISIEPRSSEVIDDQDHSQDMVSTAIPSDTLRSSLDSASGIVLTERCSEDSRSSSVDTCNLQPNTNPEGDSKLSKSKGRRSSISKGISNVLGKSGSVEVQK